MPALYDLGVALDLPINLALIMDSPDEELFSQLSMSLGRPFPEGIEKLISGWIQGLINAHQAFMIVDEFRADCDSGQLIIPHDADLRAAVASSEPASRAILAYVQLLKDRRIKAAR